MNGKDSFKVANTDYDFYWIYKGIDQGIDLKGGIYAEYECYRDDVEEISDDDIAGAISNLQDLLFDKGYSEAVVEEVNRSGNKYVRVEVAGLEDTESLMSLIGNSATLTFRSDKDTIKMTGTGNIDSCQVGYDSSEGGYYLALQFNEQGTKEFAAVTEEMKDKILYIYIDEDCVMEPKVNAVISNGRASITGNFTYDEAYQYQVKIQAGITSVKLRLNTCETVSASLGEEALSRSLIAAAIGIGIICIFMCLIYRGMGLAASCALIIYTELLVVLLAIVPWVELTLNGIAGVILSIGMAVDANVIIFERIKEIKRSSNNMMNPSAVAGGFKSAFVTILDANITTIIGAVIMIIFGSSAVKSFAITLLIGIVLSLFTAIFITRIFVNCFMAFQEDNDKFFGLEVLKEKKAADAE